MFYVYISCSDGSPLFMDSAVFNCDGVVVEYEDVWHESPTHATVFYDVGSAMRYVNEHHPVMNKVVKVMADFEARQYM